MKFKKLNAKLDNLVGKKEKGKPIDPEKLERLRQLLIEKKQRYEKKLGSADDSDKRRSIETKLYVVNAQIEKAGKLLS
jgi:hypothetical protein